MNHYDGSLTGIRPNPAGPEDMSSPGGLATIQHHWTHGLGGVGDRAPDVFAGTGERYVSGVYGHMYHPGSHGSVHERYYGPHTVATENQTLQGKPYYWQNKQSNVENFTPDVSADFDLIGDSDVEEEPPTQTLGTSQPTSKPRHRSKSVVTPNPNDLQIETSVSSVTPSKKKISAYLLLAIFLIAFVSFDLWAETAHRFLDKFYNGKTITWQRYAMISLIATILLLAVMYLLGIPVQDIEDQITA